MTLRDTGRDTRHAVRVLARRPGSRWRLVLTLALGIGGTTVIFSAMQAVFWRPLPYPDPSALVMVSTRPPRAQGAPTAVSPIFVDWRAQSPHSRHWRRCATTATRFSKRTARNKSPAPRYPCRSSLIRDTPAAGAGPVGRRRRAGRSSVVVLSHASGSGRYGGDSRVVGRSLCSTGRSHEVVGIMPRAINFPLGTEVWTPLVLTSMTRRANAARTIFGRGAADARRGLPAAPRRADGDCWPARRDGSTRQPARAGARLRRFETGIVGDGSRAGLRLLFGAVGSSSSWPASTSRASCSGWRSAGAAISPSAPPSARRDSGWCAVCSSKACSSPAPAGSPA